MSVVIVSLSLCTVVWSLQGELPVPEFDTLFWVMGAMSFAAGLMRGFAGFGSAMMLSPLFALYLGPAAAVLIIAIMEIAVSVQLVPKTVKDVNWGLLLPIVIPALICMPLGVYALTVIDGDIIAKFIAAIVLVFVLVLASGWRYTRRRYMPVTIGIGGICGVLISSTSVGGPPFLLYMVAGQESAKEVRANIISFFAILEVVTPLMLWLGGAFVMDFFVLGLFFCPPYLIGAWVGARLFRESSELLYRRVALALLTCVALYGLLS